jgi:hypothetical protein
MAGFEDTQGASGVGNRLAAKDDANAPGGRF